MAQLTKGIKLYYGTPSESTISYTALTNLTQVPDLGGTKESVEVTTLDDAARVYINGLITYGDAIEFQFIYDETQWATLSALTTTQAWKVEIPSSTSGGTAKTITFQGEPSVRLNSATVGAALYYTLSIKPSTVLTFA